MIGQGSPSRANVLYIVIFVRSTTASTLSTAGRTRSVNACKYIYTIIHTFTVNHTIIFHHASRDECISSSCHQTSRAHLQPQQYKA